LRAWLIPRGVNEEFLPSSLYRLRKDREAWESKLRARGIGYRWFTPRPDGRLSFQPEDGITSLNTFMELPIAALHLASCTNDLDLSGLRALPLEHLFLGCNPVIDDDHLRGLKLTAFRVHGHRIAGISFLRGMPLASLDLSNTAVSDLAPLAGMPLRYLRLSGTRARDLNPLAGSGITSLSVRGMTNLLQFGTSEGFLDAADFWPKWDAGRFRGLQRTGAPVAR
jgi:hypothetical protein